MYKNMLNEIRVNKNFFKAFFLSDSQQVLMIPANVKKANTNIAAVNRNSLMILNP